MNPHGWVYLDVKNDKGDLEKWQFEFGAPNELVRRGWKRNGSKGRRRNHRSGPDGQEGQLHRQRTLHHLAWRQAGFQRNRSGSGRRELTSPEGTYLKINVSNVIDESRIGAFQISTYLLCFACLLMDGFDVQSLGYVAPALSAELHISRVQLGPVLSAAPLGVLIGSILCSMLADKIGRRPVLIGTTLFYALLTWLTARAYSLEELRIVRVIGGIGMGAIMPNAMALVGEYSPRRSRVTIMMIVSNGFTAGAALGGFVAAWLLPRFGWRSVFYFGAAVPLVIAVAMIVLLPESLQFLALQGKKAERLGPLAEADQSVHRRQAARSTWCRMNRRRAASRFSGCCTMAARRARCCCGPSTS